MQKLGRIYFDEMWGEEMKKLLIFLDTDDFDTIQKFSKEFSKEKNEIIILPKDLGEFWSLDENNNMERIK